MTTNEIATPTNNSDEPISTDDLDITISWNERIPSTNDDNYSINNIMNNDLSIIESRTNSIDSYDTSDNRSIVSILMFDQLNRSNTTNDQYDTDTNSNVKILSTHLSLDTDLTVDDNDYNSMDDGLTTPKDGFSYVPMNNNIFKHKVNSSQVIEISKQSVNEDNNKVVGMKRSNSNSNDCIEYNKISKSNIDTNVLFQSSILETSRFMSEFYPVNTLGKGIFGTVYIVKKINSQEQYAIKKSIRPFNNSTYDRNYILNEVKTVTELSNNSIEFQNCNSIVRYYTAWVEDNYIYLQMELCEDSVEGMINNKHMFSEMEVIRLIYDMLTALDIIHRNNYVHLDIKPGNILKKGNHFKLSDFGLSTHITNGQATSKESVEEGDSRYMAKELLEWTKTNELRKCDMFSFGITVYEIITGIEMPMNGSLWFNLRDNNYNITSRIANNSVNRLIYHCMQKYPEDRPLTNECINRYHELFDKLDNQSNDLITLGKKLSNVSMNSSRIM